MSRIDSTCTGKPSASAAPRVRSYAYHMAAYSRVSIASWRHTWRGRPMKAQPRNSTTEIVTEMRSSGRPLTRSHHR